MNESKREDMLLRGDILCRAHKMAQVISSVENNEKFQDFMPNEYFAILGVPSP